MKLNGYFYIKQRRSIFKKNLRFWGIPSTSPVSLFSDGFWWKKDFTLSSDDKFYDDIYSVFSGNDLLFKTSSLSEYGDSITTKDKVFIIGSGPSIISQDLKKIKSENVIFLNGACSLLKTLEFRKSLLVITDDSFVVNRIGLLKEVIEIIKKRRIELNMAVSLRVLRNLLFYEIFPNQYLNFFLFEEISQELDKEECSVYDKKGVLKQNLLNNFLFGNINQTGAFHCGTVMSAAIQISAFLGYKNVYLMGFDLGNSDKPRFYEKNEDKVRCNLLQDYENGILPFMKLANEWFSKHNRNIFNCSPISLLPFNIIPYFDFNDL